MSQKPPIKRDIVERIRDLGAARPQPLLDWLEFDLLGTWVPYSAQLHAPPGFHIDSAGYVHLRGMVTGGAVGDSITQLPVGYRPEVLVSLPALCFGPGIARVDVQPASDTDLTVGGLVSLVSVSAPAGTTYVSLDGLRFRAYS